jgi:hypothetical protein
MPIREWLANFLRVPPPEGIYIKYVLKPIKYEVRYEDGVVVTEELPDYPWPKGAELTD